VKRDGIGRDIGHGRGMAACTEHGPRRCFMLIVLVTHAVVHAHCHVINVSSGVLVAGDFVRAHDGGVDYVWVPDGACAARSGWCNGDTLPEAGSLSFTMKCDGAAAVTFEALVLTPDTYADSIFIKIDGVMESTFWHLAIEPTWDWALSSPTVEIAQGGTYRVILQPREDGLKIRALNISAGADKCFWPCPANSASPAGSAAALACVCNAGSTGPDGQACVLCVAGKYKAAAGSDTCTDCEAGTYSAAEGATACSACPAGTYKSVTGSLPCAVGDVGAGFRLYAVPAATNFASRDPTGAAERGGGCARKPAGYFDVRTEWHALKINVTDLTVNASDYTFASLMSGDAMMEMGSAFDCAGDTGSIFGRAMIDLRGTPFAVEDNGIGAIACDVPPIDGGNDKRQSCSQWHTDGWRSAMEVQCTDQNQWCDIRCGGGFGGCELAVGYLQLKVLDSQAFGDGTGAIGACPADSSSPAGSDALTDCRCNAGYTGPDGGECSACPVGTFKDAAGSAECLACPSSNASSPAGSDHVTDCQCNAGYAGINGGECTACPAGKYKAERGGGGSYRNCTSELDCKVGGSTGWAHCASEDGVCHCNGRVRYGDAGSNTWTTPKNVSGSISCSHTVFGDPIYGVVKTCQCDAVTAQPHCCAGRCVCDHGCSYELSTACTVGRFCDDPTDIPSSCAGGSDTCTDCEAGKYSATGAATANSTCEACRANSASPAGSTGSTDCQCNAGYTGPDGGECAASTPSVTTTSLATTPTITRTITGSLESADADGDGSLSPVELASYTSANGGQGDFQAIDSDSNGAISADEFDTYVGTLPSADTNANGVLESSEFEQYMKAYGGNASLVELDTDGDGHLSSAEFSAFTGTLASADTDGNDILSVSELAQYRAVYGGSDNFTLIDLNSDGSADASEFDAYTVTLAAADSNKDGLVSPHELAKYLSVYDGEGSFHSIDLNGDQSIDEREFLKHFVDNATTSSTSTPAPTTVPEHGTTPAPTISTSTTTPESSTITTTVPMSTPSVTTTSLATTITITTTNITTTNIATTISLPVLTTPTPMFVSCGIKCRMQIVEWKCNTTCGDGLRAGFEECDDGNDADGDGCRCENRVWC